MATALATVLILVVVAFLIWGVLLYNRLVALDNGVDRAWANVDVALKQRNDELPNLVRIVEGYARHERGLFEEVTRARALVASAATIPEKAHADALISRDVPQIFAVAEAYPDLKANESFRDLQSRLSAIEDLIADRREFYNQSVVLFNTRIREVPDTVLARWMRLAPHPYFKAEPGASQPPLAGA